MIRVVAKNYIKAGSENQFIAVFKELVEETRKEAGCVFYDLCQEVNNPTVLTVLEEWKTMEDLDLHMKTPHFTKVVPLLSEFSEKDMEVNIYTKVL